MENENNTIIISKELKENLKNSLNKLIDSMPATVELLTINGKKNYFKIEWNEVKNGK